MQIIIDSEKLKNSEINFPEFLMLLGIYYGYTINSKTYKNLHSLGYVVVEGYEDKIPSKMSITYEGKTALEGMLADAKIEDNSDTKYEELATKMIELFPKGRKPGTNYMWRGSKLEIIRKLKTLTTKYEVPFNEDKILKATENYVKSFNGDYRTMRLLKYFIFKIEVKDGKEEFCSELLSRIDNLDQEDSDIEDWTTTLC